MSWCEDNDVFYVLGLARNSGPRLAQERVKRHAGSVTSATGPASLGHCRTSMVGISEYLAKGSNPRSVVTVPVASSGGGIKRL